jgi:hypothetical protein
MRQALLAGIVALGVAVAVPRPANACPECRTGDCVGWNVWTPWARCIQLPDHGCILQGGDCRDDESLNAPLVAPDGSVTTAPAGGLKVVTIASRSGRIAARYSVTSCRNYVVARTYAAGEGARRRNRTSAILI